MGRVASLDHHRHNCSAQAQPHNSVVFRFHSDLINHHQSSRELPVQTLALAHTITPEFRSPIRLNDEFGVTGRISDSRYRCIDFKILPIWQPP